MCNHDYLKAQVKHMQMVLERLQGQLDKYGLEVRRMERALEQPYAFTVVNEETGHKTPVRITVAPSVAGMNIDSEGNITHHPGKSSENTATANLEDMTILPDGGVWFPPADALDSPINYGASTIPSGKQWKISNCTEHNFEVSYVINQGAIGGYLERFICKSCGYEKGGWVEHPGESWQLDWDEVMEEE